MSADIKVPRTSLLGLPPLGTPVSYYDFAFNIGDYVDTTVHLETGHTSGVDRVFVEAHNCTLNRIPASQVQVLLLATDASAGLPPLPSGYAAQINALNANPSWLAGSQWQFVDPSSPYRALVRDLDVRTPQVVEYAFDFSAVPLPSGHDHVCLAAFVTAPQDPITATTTDLDQATMIDKHIALRSVVRHVVDGVQTGFDLPMARL
jgi:hypothetical protein